jgi:hypothetical protein
MAGLAEGWTTGIQTVAAELGPYPDHSRIATGTVRSALWSLQGKSIGA